MVAKCDKVAHHPAGKRVAPAVRKNARTTSLGVASVTCSNDCRSFVGALTYVSRDTRPGVAFATNWLARSASAWAMARDVELGQLAVYLNATSELCLESTVHVRDRRGGLWLEVWVSAEHTGEPQR